MKSNSKPPLMTSIFLGLSILVYLFMIIVYGTSTDSRVLLQVGAKFNYLMINENQWWRLISAAFIHIGFTHLLLNGISIYFMGLELEPLLGKLRFSIIYLGAAIGGNLFSFAFNPLNISAGASTSIFGLFASFIGLGYLFPQSKEIKARASNFMILIALNFINSLRNTDIDNWGHFGGALFGLLFTLLVCLPSKSDNKKRIYILLGILLAMVVLLLYGFYNFNRVI